ncbi:hypothetical protein [Spiroplasma poulsonii]|uniref:hypothetical protein n=1 Tax=Spiroplasma poulsonii TaxID=2138 RepID=UPI003A5C7F2F
MIKLLLLMLPKLQSNPIQKKEKKQSYSGKKKKNTHDQNTSNYRTRNQKKLLQQVFRSEKNMIMLYLKNQKSQF